ncbi:MAG: aminotransferase class I/II-fold pyridoxal phosphate-dependent enzyme [Ruminococcus sp.]|nr:aminotransferase class I/II-fold pyridoxal phosphate-dependent enzyme [Ruminococcus sp.]
MNHEHGGNIYKYNNIIDFSANINPLGMPYSVREAVINSADAWEKYPDPDCLQLRKMLSNAEEFPFENIVLGNGADDLIYRIVHCFNPQKAVIYEPTFGEYEKALKEIDCDVYRYFIKEEDSFKLTADILEMLTPDMDILFLCSPNNPTGRLISPELLKKISERCMEHNIILVCDECFMGFVENGEIYSLKQCINKNSIILKAFTKLYAMPGLRLGYALCGGSNIAEKIHRSGQFWSVSIPAQAAGIAALKEEKYVCKTIDFVKSEREFLIRELQKYDVKVFPSDANYLLLKSSKQLDERLVNNGILVRNCANYMGLCDGFYRIAVRTHEENKLLISALRRCIHG